MSGMSVLENVSRCRAIASLYRRTAALKPLQKGSLLDRAEEWDQVALAQLESYFWRAERQQPAW